MTPTTGQTCECDHGPGPPAEEDAMGLVRELLAEMDREAEAEAAADGGGRRAGWGDLMSEELYRPAAIPPVPEPLRGTAVEGMLQRVQARRSPLRWGRVGWRVGGLLGGCQWERSGLDHG